MLKTPLQHSQVQGNQSRGEMQERPPGFTSNAFLNNSEQKARVFSGNIKLKRHGHHTVKSLFIT